MSIFNVSVLILGLFVIREIYTPVLLRLKTASDGKPAIALRVAKEQKSQMAANLMRPLRLLVQRPIIWITALTGTLSFAAYTLMLSTYATLWIDKYGQSELISSLRYISIALGSTLCGQVGGHIMDHIYQSLSKRADGKGVPEFRIPYMFAGMIIEPTGLFWYGWSAERLLSWAIVDSGVVVFTLGSFIVAQATTAYQIIEYEEFAASAGAASRSVSYLLAFFFPIFAPDLYEKLGYGWGNSILAFVWVGLGIPTCAVLWYLGVRVIEIGKAK